MSKLSTNTEKMEGILVDVGEQLVNFEDYVTQVGKWENDSERVTAKESSRKFQIVLDPPMKNNYFSQVVCFSQQVW